MLRRTLITTTFLGFFASQTFGQGIQLNDLSFPLSDVSLGNPEAPVTIEEYASLTCPHCASFHEKVFPRLKSEYIDTGKVRFILKPFALDAVSAGAFLLSRCDGDDDFYPRIDRLFATQSSWMSAPSPRDALLETLKPFGFDADKFNACLENKSALQWVMESRDKADFVTGTPTFVINGGQPIKGNMDPQLFIDIIDATLN